MVNEEGFSNAEVYLYSRLHRKYGVDYIDPFESGPRAMAALFDSFIEFIRRTYDPHPLGEIHNLWDLIDSEIQSLGSGIGSRIIGKNYDRNDSREFSYTTFIVIAEILRGMPVKGRKQLLDEYPSQTMRSKI
ncbi:MAG: hypothetical protein EOP07_00460 [Proteobacteria bacterium]|nr:MAG: hypothetical protein EOP07_00460 [Pseudomonadota bacterium]